MLKRHILAIALTLLALPLAASEPCGRCVAAADEDCDARPLRPVFAAYTAEFGSAHLTDTYLTPLKYDGWHAALDYQRYQAMRFDPDRWTMRLHFNLGVDKTDNPARNATMWNLMLSADWGMMRKFRPFSPDLTLAVGGSTGVDLGCLYNARNGNNPASAKASWTVNLTGFASWRTRLWSLPVTLNYHAHAPGGRSILFARLWRALL